MGRSKTNGSEPNNWLSRFGGSSWTYDDASGQYYLHTFLSSQPDLNWRNPAVRAEMAETLRFWLGRGVDGFRTDSIYVLIKDALLRDDPINPDYHEGISDPADKFLQQHSAGQTELLSVLDDICDIVAVDGDSFLVSEAYLGIEEMKPLYRACQKHPIHAPFNFNLMSLTWGASSFGDWIDQYEASLGGDNVPNYVLGNHDRPRLASRVGLERARLLAMLQMTLRGLPVVYYGDELGLENAVIATEDAQDPWGIAVPGFDRDIARGPMPWSGEAHNGFSNATPWLKAKSSTGTISVAGENRSPESTLSLYRQLIHLKATLPALHYGSYRRVETDNPDIYAFMREYHNNRCLIVINFSEIKTIITPKDHLKGHLLCSTHSVDGEAGHISLNALRMGEYEARIYEIEAKKS
ncbi:MAG: alpha-amylase family glycosyl hydrolase [Candidatus Saccharibacteria bacterium]